MRIHANGFAENVTFGELAPEPPADMFAVLRGDDASLSDVRPTAVPDVSRMHLTAALANVLNDCRDDVPLSDVRESIDRLSLQFQRQTGAVEALPVIGAQRLADEPVAVEYLIPGILAANQPGMIGGGFKTLKTNVSIDLTLSLALGVQFLGTFPVSRPVRTLLLSGESGQAVIRETAERVSLSKGYPLRQAENALFGFELPRMGDGLRRLERTLRDNGIEVLILDPMYLMLPHDIEAGNIFKMGAVLRDIGAVATDCGVTPALVHHTKRGIGREPFSPPELMDLAWAGFSEFARQWILVGRREAYDPASGGVHRLWLSVGGSAGHTGLWALDIDERAERIGGARSWGVYVRSASEARRDSQDEREREREGKRAATAQRNGELVLRCLERFPAGVTRKALKEATGLRADYFGSAFDRLFDSGSLEPCKVKGGNGREYDAYRLATGNRGTRNGELFPDG